ncbi:MAG: iron-sulfur cluster assembly accessory protein [Candidatus Acidiferrales bacterium]
MSALEPVTINTAGQTHGQSDHSSNGHGAGHEVEISNAPNSPQKGIHLTDRALKQIRVAMKKENISPEQGGLRLGVQGGGCSGLSYNIRFDTQSRERDRVYDYDGMRVFVDPKSFIYLNGMTLDYEETLIRQGFNFINPNSTKSCGCGSSFSG